MPHSWGQPQWPQLSPEEALVVFAELRKARHSFVLESELHIIYLVRNTLCAMLVSLPLYCVI